MPQPRVGDLDTERQVQAGELRESGNVLQPRVRDRATAGQVQAGELRELGNVLQPRARNLVTHVQAGDVLQAASALKHTVLDAAPAQVQVDHHANRPTVAATQSPKHSGRMRSFSRTLGPYTSSAHAARQSRHTFGTAPSRVAVST